VQTVTLGTETNRHIREYSGQGVSITQRTARAQADSHCICHLQVTWRGLLYSLHSQAITTHARPTHHVTLRIADWCGLAVTPHFYCCEIQHIQHGTRTTEK